MKLAFFCMLLSLAFAAAPARAADAGVYSIVEGESLVLRGATWFKLVPGTRFQEGDLIEATERAQVQVELTSGGALNLIGPATLYAAAVPMRDDKLAGKMEFMLPRGWLKLVAKAPATGVRMRFSVETFDLTDGIVVVRAATNSIELFLEAGAATISDLPARGRENVARDAKAGEFWSRSGDRPFFVEQRAPPSFVTAMPRHLLDPLPSFAGKFKTASGELAVDHEITYAEAQPWLTGPYRKTFLKRFRPRLSDPAFRDAVNANIAAYPEWDRILHPEKYRPKEPK